MQKKEAEKSIKASLSLIGKRVDKKGPLYEFAQNCSEHFMNQWDTPKIQSVQDHLIRTSEYTAKETLTPSCFIASLFHHLEPDFVGSDCHEAKKILALFSSVNKEFKQLDILISNINATNKVQLEQFKKNTNKLVNLLKHENGLDALFVLLASKLDELQTNQFPENWHNSSAEIAERALFFFVPFTHFLGLNLWTALMEVFALQILAPEDITNRRHYIDVKIYDQYIPAIEKELLSLLEKKPSINILDFSWRTKGIFSLWEKRYKTGAEPRDIIGFRIVVEYPAQCYEVRNRILSRFRIRRNKHDDYFLTIAFKIKILG